MLQSPCLGWGFEKSPHSCSDEGAVLDYEAGDEADSDSRTDDGAAAAPDEFCSTGAKGGIVQWPSRLDAEVV